MADGQVVFEITGDSKGIETTVKSVTNNISSESKKWDQSAKEATDSISGSFADMAKKIAASIAAAGIGTILMNWGKAAVDAASDLAEVQNVVDTVFGSGADQIERWAKNAGSQFGLTETQAKKFTSTLGAMMKSSGLAGNEIVQMSTDLAGLAADMASFYNLDFETAFEKIRAGISGETMPLKQLGINMSVANLNAFALAQGLEKTFEKMDQGEQTMLRYQYIMQATADAQGDFEKTSDGFANAQRRITTALDTISTTAGTFLLTTIEPLVSGVASFLEKMTATPERTILDDFNEIEVDAAGKLADLNATYDKAKSIIDLIDEMSKKTVTLGDGSSISFGDLFTDISSVEKAGGDINAYIESLGLDVDYIVQKYNVWKESTRQLTSLIPGLTSVIDKETGAINGGTDALRKNLDEWKTNEEKKLAWTAYYAKARALEEKKAEMYLYEFDAGAARQATKNALEEVQKVIDGTDLTIRYDEDGSIITYDKTWMSELTAEQRAFNTAAKGYNAALENQKKAEKDLESQTVDLTGAEEELANGKQALIEKYGEEEEAAIDAANAAEYYKGKSDEAWKTSLKGAQNAVDSLKAVTDYYEKARDKAIQSINSTIKGFDLVGGSIDKTKQKSSELANKETETLRKYGAVWAKYGANDDSLKKMAERWDKLSATEKKAYEELVKIRNQQKEVNETLDQYKPETMKKGLEEQIKYMENYLANLDKLKQWGVSGELLAFLSDGSKDSAEYLQGLVDGGEEAAKEVGEQYKKVEEQKKKFADELTKNQLSVDDVYNGLVQTAQNAMSALDLGEEAKNAMGSTVQGIAAGIRDNVSVVSAEVSNLLSALAPLTKFGFNWGFSDGSFILNLDGSNEKGLDYVPFDGYLSELHEGEGILTAEENRIWQRFKNGQQGHANVDYEALGGVMRDNVKAGGDVYLDGRTVGQVVSGIQGRSYRNLQRSGWQG